MGKWEDTQVAYFDTKEKVMPERERLCMAQAMKILQNLRENITQDCSYARALDGAFKFIDKAVHIMEHGADKESLITQNDMIDLAVNMIYIHNMRNWLKDGGLTQEAFDVFIQWIDDASMYIRYTGKTGFSYGKGMET